MVNHMRHTRSQTGQRRSHHALVEQRFSACANCGAPHLRHRACAKCGNYRGRNVINVLAKIEKKSKKKSEREKLTSKQ